MKAGQASQAAKRSWSAGRSIMLVNRVPGARARISIGRRGEQADLYNAKLVSQPQIVAGVNGQLMEVGTFIVEQINLQGEKYLTERPHNLRFAYDRTERVESLDGTAEQPKTWQELVKEAAASSLAFNATRAPKTSVANIEDLA